MRVLSRWFPAFALVLVSCGKAPPSPPAAHAAAAAPSVIDGASSVELPDAAPVDASAVVGEVAPACMPAKRVAIFVTPQSPIAREPFRIVVVAEHMAGARLSATAPDGTSLVTDASRPGPPAWAVLEVKDAKVGTYKAIVNQVACADAPLAEETIEVKSTRSGPPRATWAAVWSIRHSWSAKYENLYSAWIEKLFDAPIDQQLTWPALHEVLRDPARNMLHNHLGLDEDRADEKALVIRPDCADLPYFLRAYFAFKWQLPFAYSSCSRGSGGQAPTCPGWTSIVDPKASRRAGTVSSFGHFIRWTLADGVHSGSARTSLDDDQTDYYGVDLSVESVRPGTIYADPYGHVLVVARRIPQTKSQAGLLLAVDGQPDGTVARKRFWRGNFLFAQDPALGGPGFKRFRPLTWDKGRIRRLTNAEIEASYDYGDWSLEQGQMSVEQFYDKMDDVISPAPLDPERALLEAIDALEEQVKTRVNSVENGRKFLAKGGKSAEMPDGPEIFETTGAWEDFSTPSRDLRLLIAIDVVKTFPDRVLRRRDHYKVDTAVSDTDLRAKLESVLSTQLKQRSVRYIKTDGSEFALTLADVAARAQAFETAYNPNDCPEIRWGAEKGSDEMATCKRHASWGQRSKMNRYRAWFSERKRPPRK